MLSYIYHILNSFRSVFSRQVPWISFCMVVLGLIGAYQMAGISSLCRFWQMNEAGYMYLLHLFHSQAWSIQTFIYHWWQLALEQQVAVMEGERLVLLGDHTYVPKDGRHMPGVVSIHQNSETQSKPSYFRGHFWGLIGLLIGTPEHSFCLPLEARIHQGFTHLNQRDKEDKDSTAMRLVRMALDFSIRHNKPAILILDAFFSVKTVFRLANTVWSVVLKAPLLYIITRAKKNYVAYFPAVKPDKPRPGAPCKYGEKIKLIDVFENCSQDFQEANCLIYGKMENISYLALNLLWKPTGGLIRFVFARTSLGLLVLMCSDLEIDPLKAISLYCYRIRVEILFDMLKNVLGAFCYHFWTKGLPRHSRRPKKNKDLKKPSQENLFLVRQCWEAYERFVMIGCVTLGILQLVSLKFKDQVWAGFQSFLRTRSRSLPSEGIVKEVIAQELRNDFIKVADDGTMGEIHRRLRENKLSWKDKRSEPMIKKKVA